MKNIFSYLVFLLFISTTSSSCQSQLKKNMIPKIKDTFETFEKEDFEITKKRILKKEGIYIEQEYQNPGYISRSYFNDYSFMVIKKFFEYGGIMEKAIVFNNGSPYGIWYKFNEKGELIEELNTDAGYTFSWQQVIAYCEEHKIPLTKGYEKGGYQTSIYKKEVNGKKVWEISHLVAADKIAQKILDGETGELLKEEFFEFVNH